MPSALIIGQGGGVAGGSVSNASVGLNGSAGPNSSTQIGDIVAGVFTAFSATNPLPITGTILANNLSVGPTGSPVPSDATFIGVQNASGNLVGVSASNPVRTDPTGTTVQPVSGTFWQATQPVSGTIAFSNTTIAATQSGTWNIGSITALPAVTIAAAQTIAVTNAGTFVVQATLAAETTNITAGTAPTNGLATLVVYNSTPPTLTTGQSVAVQSDTTGSTYVNTEGRKATYRAVVKAFIPIASVSAPLFSIQGSATKVIRISEINISWSCTVGFLLSTDVFLQKFSVLTGGVTAVTVVPALNDSADSAPTAVCLQYSTAPTTATAIGGITAAERMVWATPSITTYAPDDDVDWEFGEDHTQLLVLRGTSEYFGVVVTDVAVTLPLMTLWIEWTEE